MSRIRVKKNEEKPESKEILAEAIVNIGNAARKLSVSGLNRRAIVALLYDMTKINKTEIGTILDGLNQLENWYCR